MAGNFRDVTPRVWLVGSGGWGGGEQFSRRDDCNVYLIDGGGEFALVDAGLGPENPQILENIRAAGLATDRIRKVFLTHAHNDHAQAAPWLRRETGARIYAGPVTARVLREGERNLTGPMQPFEKFVPWPFEVDEVLEDGGETPVGDLVLKTLHTHGHSIDSISFVCDVDGRKVLFGGDTLIGRQSRADFGGHTFACVLGWLDGHWSAPLTTYVESLKTLQALNSDLLLPGHGVPNDAMTLEKAVKAGIKSIERVLDDPDLFVMFSVSR